MRLKAPPSSRRGFVRTRAASDVLEAARADSEDVGLRACRRELLSTARRVPELTLVAAAAAVVVAVVEPIATSPETAVEIGATAAVPLGDLRRAALAGTALETSAEDAASVWRELLFFIARRRALDAGLSGFQERYLSTSPGASFAPREALCASFGAPEACETCCCC